MNIFHNLEEWQQFRANLDSSLRVGFVPTMGNLHVGHASLYKICKQENDKTIASLFINPTQFNQASDFTLYPRTLEEDLALLQAEGVDYCLLPDEKSMYADQYNYQVHEQALSQHMEGKYRPGHFTGMLTVVMKLLNLVKPHKAYFGEKDYQQYLLIRGMCEALFMGTEIIPCPTIREASGLAYSSRNNRLSQDERKQAEKFAQLFHQDKSCALIREELEAEGIKVDYVEEFEGRRFAAVYVGPVRLIDNYNC